MKLTVLVLLVGACVLVTAASPILERGSSEAEDTQEVSDPCEVETEPAFNLEPESEESSEIKNPPFFKSGDHDRSEMELLGSIMHSLTDFTPCLNSQGPSCALDRPQAQNGCLDCADAQFLIMKVVGLLRSLANLLSLVGSPQLSETMQFQDAPFPAFGHPGPYPHPMPLDPHFANQDEARKFDEALSAIVSAIMEQLHEEGVSDEESAEEKAVEILAEEMEREIEVEKAEEIRKEEEIIKSEEVVKKDLHETPEEVEAVAPKVESEAPRKARKKSKKKKSKEPTTEVPALDEEHGSMMNGLEDVFTPSE